MWRRPFFSKPRSLSSTKVLCVTSGLITKPLWARNNLRLLRRFGGTWITPDITLPEQNTIRKAVIRQTMELTGIDVSENTFPDAAHARSFFETLGFEVEQRSFMEVVDQLASPKKLGMTDSDVEQMISWRVAFVMRNRKSATLN